MNPCNLSQYFLLKVGGVTILLDCGWDIGFGIPLLAPLKEVVKRVDLVLISHSDLEHLGGLPYAVGSLGLSAPIYATLPTIKMGQMTLYDAHQNRLREKGSDEAPLPFNLDDVDKAFESCQPLKFSQLLSFSESSRGAGITIKPLPAGRLIGGSIWRICWRTEDNDIVYAVSFNHRREDHLNGGVLESLSRPSIMITDAHNALSQQKPRKQRVPDLIDAVMATMRCGGDVLMPTDTAGRTLELLLLLENHWSKSRLGSYKLVLLNNMAFNTVEFARSQLEWMSDAISRQFDLQRSNPFELRHVHIIHSMEELDALGSKPKVVLASDLSLDTGFAKALLLRWAFNPSSLVLLTTRGADGALIEERATTAHKILQDLENQAKLEEGRGGLETGVCPPTSIPMKLVIKVPKRISLQGDELNTYLEKEARLKRAKEEEEELLRQKKEMESGHLVADSDDDAEEEEAGNVDLSKSSQRSQSSLKKRRCTISTSLYHTFSKPQHLMFGCAEQELMIDDYGVREPEPIGWLSVSMHDQRKGGDIPTVASAPVSGSGLSNQDNGMLQELAEASGSIENEQLVMESVYYEDQDVVPCKIISEEKEIELLMRRMYIDMEGLSDGRSIKNLISTIGPRQLVIIGGSSKALNTVVCHAKERKAADQVLTPSNGENVKVSLDTEVLDVLLHDSLYSHLRWHSIRGYQLARVESIVKRGECKKQGQQQRDCSVLYPLEKDSGNENLTTGKELSNAVMSAAKGNDGGWGTGHPAIFVSFGDMQLTQLSTALRRAGMSISFAAARILVNDRVTVSKDKDGKLNLEGPLGDDFFAIRRVIYEQYEII